MASVSRIRRAFPFGPFLPILLRLCRWETLPCGSILLPPSLCRACFRNAHSGRGRINNYRFVSPEDKAKRKGARRSKKMARGRRAGKDNDSAWPAFDSSRLRSAQGLLMGFSRTLWSYATIAEVYTLNTLLILTVFFLMLRWRRGIVADRSDIGCTRVASERHDSLSLCRRARVWLGAGGPSRQVGLTLPALAVIVYRTEG